MGVDVHRLQHRDRSPACASGTLQTHVAARALFEGFLDEISAKGYRVRDGSGYSFRCTDGSGGWSCPGGDPSDLSNHAWGLAIDINAGTNPIRSYSSIDGATACMTPIQTDMPQWVIQTAEKWGLYWGGYGWNSGCQSTSTQRTVVSRDPPHFEFRGTPRQAAAIAAFNLHNDPNAVCRTIVDDAGHDVEQCATLGAAGGRRAAAGAAHAACGRGGGDDQPHRDRGRRAGFPHARGLRPPAPGPRTTSALTYAAGQSVAVMAIVPISSTGRFCVYRSSAVHTDRRRHRLPRLRRRTAVVRAVDTDSPDRHACGRRLPAGSGAASRAMLPAFTKQFVPTDSNDARIVNLTVVDSQAPGWLQVGRCAESARKESSRI